MVCRYRPVAQMISNKNELGKNRNQDMTNVQRAAIELWIQTGGCSAQQSCSRRGAAESNFSFLTEYDRRQKFSENWSLSFRSNLAYIFAFKEFSMIVRFTNAAFSFISIFSLVYFHLFKINRATVRITNF